MRKTNLDSEIVDLVLRVTGVSDDVTPDSGLDDLGLDSLDFVEILIEISEVYDIHLDELDDFDSAFDSLKVQDIINAVSAKQR